MESDERRLLPLDEEFTGDFYEDDEPVEKVREAFRRAPKVITAPPSDGAP